MNETSGTNPIRTIGARNSELFSLLKKAANAVRYYYPFTSAGTVLLTVSVYLFIMGVTGSNPYALLLSFGSFLLLSVLAVFGRLTARRLASHSPSWDPSASVYAEREGSVQRFSFSSVSVPPFFRMNILVKGPLVAGRSVSFKFRREISIVNGSFVDVPLYFPLSGIFHARAITRVRDLFGLSVSRFGEVTFRQLNIQAPPLVDVLSERIEAAGGFEEKSKRKSSDEEKYYMREYIPGDRLRDINWKSSSRLSQLITRISPQAQEKTRIVQIIIRNFSNADHDTIMSASHLHFLKRWFIAFVRNIKKEHPEYRFNILFGNGEQKLIESNDDLELFSLALSGLGYLRELPKSEELSWNEGYVFTTPFDTYLPVFLARNDRVKFHVFSTAVPLTGDEKREPILIRLLPLSGTVPLPTVRTVISSFRKEAVRQTGFRSFNLMEQTLRVRLL